MEALRRLSRPAMLALADVLDGDGPGHGGLGARVHEVVPAIEATAVMDAIKQAGGKGMQPHHVAVMLRLLAVERADTQAVADRCELVWSGTECGGAASRDTAVVVQELFATAKHSLLVASYALDTGEKARNMFQALAGRMDGEPNLTVRFFVNVHRRYGDETDDAGLVRAFASVFRTEVWPGSRAPEVFYDPRALAIGGETRACLHAKCVVADEERAFVTSANFTRAAQDRNIEAGVLLDDARIAQALSRHFEVLRERGELRRLPGVEQSESPRVLAAAGGR